MNSEMKILVKRVKDEHGWISCMAPHTVMYNGTLYRTPEALFQSLRFHKHPEIQKELWDARSPMGVKMIARKHQVKLNRVGKWDEAPEDLVWMKQVLTLKLEQHPELHQMLIDTGNATIIEDCTSHDRESARFWGMVLKDGNWIGENILGKLWMELRNELKQN
jgi:hypothetical protein